jgi:NADP-dependent 3-hydroxy acid dehydrogenase YdfG
MEEIREKLAPFQPFDYLVNCAGTAIESPFLNFTIDAFDRLVAKKKNIFNRSNILLKKLISTDHYFLTLTKYFYIVFSIYKIICTGIIFTFRIMAVNLRGAAVVSQIVAKEMIAHSIVNASIVHISSQSSTKPLLHHTPYCMNTF